MNKLRFLLLTLVLFGLKTGLSNNIQVGDVTISGSTIVFDLSWDNSWNDNTNYDAAWVFVKYRYPNGNWIHVTLNKSGHILPLTANSDMPDDAKGIFIRRSGAGTGDNDFNNIVLSWNTMADGVSSTLDIQVKVIAIEMVYVPQGKFYLGDDIAFGRFRQVGIDEPAKISTASIIVKCENTSHDDSQLEGDGILVDGNGGIDTDGTTVVDNPDFPTGYEAFYCMKYEISQGQYADFLNTLNATQVISRYYESTSYRHTIAGTWPGYSASAPDRACNYLSWMDGCAYADWAGLRPMTELEYEKAGRGTSLPVNNEYAWGNTSLHSTAYTLTGSGTSNELISSPGTNTGNALYDDTGTGIGGPVRCGIFAASAIGKTRQETGATFYGIMEMSGNLVERTVSLGKIDGRNYTGVHGDGVLSGTGYANQALWPGTVSGIVQSPYGSGCRGGGFYRANEEMMVSDREWASQTNSNHGYSFGYRCVRTAP